MALPKPQTLSDYAGLLRKVKITLIEGQQRIEQEKVRTYWETGRLIHAHILQHKDRADYGGEVVIRLSGDLNISTRILHQCIQFVRIYPRLPIVNGRSQFKWSHYRELFRIADDRKRGQLQIQAAQKGWSAEELAGRINESRPFSPKPSELKTLNLELLTPLRGELDVYQVVERPTVGGDPELLVDLGFGIFRKLPSRSHLAKGDFVSSTAAKGSSRTHPRERSSATAGLPHYGFYKIEASIKDLYTYRAVVEKVVDGDTLKVRIDLGYDDSCRQVLRLRGIDCPELPTKEGQAAKTFISETLIYGAAPGDRKSKGRTNPRQAKRAAGLPLTIKEAQMIIVRSSRSDNWDRYLADVFIPLSNYPNKDENIPRTPKERKGISLPRNGEERVGITSPLKEAEGEEIFLNNLLLEKGYATRWKG